MKGGPSNHNFTQHNDESKDAISIPISTLKDIRDKMLLAGKDLAEFMETNNATMVEKAPLIVSAISRQSFVLGAVKYYLGE